MEENKKGNKVLVIAVVILSILVIALGGYICYDKVISKNNDAIRRSAITPLLSPFVKKK